MSRMLVMIAEISVKTKQSADDSKKSYCIQSLYEHRDNTVSTLNTRQKLIEKFEVEVKREADDGDSCAR